MFDFRRKTFKIDLMVLPDIVYHKPKSFSELFKIISNFRIPHSEFRIIAGGTDILPELKEASGGRINLISLNYIPELKEIRLEKDFLQIGSMVTLSEILNSIQIPKEYGALKEAVSTMASPQIRTRATIGGNITSAVPSADLPPILIAFDSSVILKSEKGERQINLSDFFLGPRKTVLKENEILKAIEIPLTTNHPARLTACYLKEGRRSSLSLAVASVACALWLDDSVCQKARIVLGAVAPIPLFAEKASKLLEGTRLNAQTLEKVADEVGSLAQKECAPISDIRGSCEYREELVKVLTKRALSISLKRIISPPQAD